MSRSRIKLMCVLMGVVVVTQLDRPGGRDGIWICAFCLLEGFILLFLINL